MAAPEEWDSLKQTVQRYAVPAAIGIGMALAVLIVFNYLTDKKSTAESDASSMLSAASGPPDLEAIVSDYPDTSTAPLALLHLASINFKNANFPVASEKYSDFLSAYPEHVFAGAAELGRVHCLESLGKLEDALESYRTFAAANENHYLMAQAVMGEGRTLEQLGRFEDATSVYEAYISAHPDVPGVDQIEAMLEKAELKVKTPELAEYTKTIAPAESLFPSTPGGGSDDFLSTLIQQTPPPQDVPESTQTPVPAVVPPVEVPEAVTPVEVPPAATDTPSVVTPAVAVPEVTTPVVSVPEVKAPEVKAPEIKAPEVKTPVSDVPVDAPAPTE